MILKMWTRRFLCDFLRLQIVVGQTVHVYEFGFHCKQKNNENKWLNKKIFSFLFFFVILKLKMKKFTQFRLDHVGRDRSYEILEHHLPLHTWHRAAADACAASLCKNKVPNEPFINNIYRRLLRGS